MYRYPWMFSALLLTGGAFAAAPAQQPPSTASLLEAERAAIAPLAQVEGVWRGKATMTLRSGKKHTITQTERVGPFLGGSVLVIEGRGYESDGRLSFNALGIVSYNPMTRHYSMHSYAQGYSGDFAMKVTADGFSWTLPEGPVTLRYAATIKNGIWHEVGDRLVPGGKPMCVFEMTLKRVGSTDWPEAGAVPFKP